ncbi:MAG: extracellular solute-binding protein [Cellulomonadaceae bacterium]|jgi:cellobiose transport system substrate-binding protein|nr:extracellular solute-binding protein [Cellulomonadaceae bacterium]
MRSLKAIGASAAALALTLSVAACGGGDDAGSGSDAASGGDVTIKIQTFNNMGFSAPTDTRPGADLWSKYEADNPGVKIEETVAATSDDARAAFNTAIQAGTASFDIFAVEIDWLPSIQAIPDSFLDLNPFVGDNDWLDWKLKQGTTLDGSKLLGMGTDIGPQGICYRADLLDAAGIASDRDAVKEWLGGDDATWDDFFKAGAEYMDKSGGKAFFDSSAAIFQGMINQIEYSWVDADGNIIADTNADAKTAYDKLTAAAVAGQSAGLGQWSDAWNAGMSTDQFAAQLCPAWLVNNIRGAAGDDFVGWDIADVFPGGGGNWGGSFLVVPEASAVKEDAAKLVAYITSPDAQAEVFATAANFPSSPTALGMEQVTSRMEPFLNNAPIGEIYANRAAAVTVVPFKGAQYFEIQTSMADALNRVDVDKSMDPAASWAQFLNDVDALK